VPSVDASGATVVPTAVKSGFAMFPAGRGTEQKDSASMRRRNGAEGLLARLRSESEQAVDRMVPR
jgi:hypothetical protein